MNRDRKTIGGRIDSIIKTLGIKLGKDEKIAITVDGKNQLKVSGVKDKQRAKKIEEALNADETLGRDMRKHSLAGKMEEYARAQTAYEKDYAAFSDAIDQDTDTAFVSPGMRSFIIDEYLRDEADISLADLTVEHGSDGASIGGMNSALNALLAEDETLGATIIDIIDKGEVETGFSTTFEFANGTISDATTADAAKEKIQKVRTYLMGGVDPETGDTIRGILPSRLESIMANTNDVDEELVQAMSRGFGIRVAANGDFEIIGQDDLAPKYKQLLEGLVQEALQASGVNSFAEISDAYIQQHQFEDGDTHEYAHMVEINFAAGGSEMAKVVSPEADKAKDEANQKVADELGGKLMSMLAEQGIDTAGMELEIDESGKIKVLGGASEQEIQKAQMAADQFVKEAQEQTGSVSDKDKEEERRLERERRMEKDEEGKTSSHVPDGFAERDVVAHSDSAAMQDKAWRNEMVQKVIHLLPGQSLESDEAKTMFETFLSWQKYMPNGSAPANSEPHLTNNADPVSAVEGPHFGGVGEKEDSGNGGDAARLYRELVDGMNGFHDERRKVSYRMGAAA